MSEEISSPSSSSMWFDVGKINGPQKSPISTDDNPATIRIAQFAPVAKISFGEVKLGVEKIATIRLQNPQGVPQSVWFEKFPVEKRVTLDADGFRFNVPANDSILIHVKWTPIEAGKFREMLSLKGDGNFRTQAVLLGSAIDPVPKKKKRASVAVRPKLATIYPSNTGKTRKIPNTSGPADAVASTSKMSKNVKPAVTGASSSASSCISKPSTSKSEESQETITESFSDFIRQTAALSDVLMSGTFVIQQTLPCKLDEDVNYHFVLTPERRLTFTRPRLEESPKVVPRKLCKQDAESDVSNSTTAEDVLSHQTYICPMKGEFTSVRSPGELPSCDFLSTPSHRQTYTKCDEDVQIIDDPKLQKLMLSTLPECSDSMEVSILQDAAVPEEDPDQKNPGFEDVQIIKIEPPSNIEHNLDVHQQIVDKTNKDTDAKLVGGGGGDFSRFSSVHWRHLEDDPVTFSPDSMAIFCRAVRPGGSNVAKMTLDAANVFGNSAGIVLDNDAFGSMPQPGPSNIDMKTKEIPRRSRDGRDNHPWRKPFPMADLAPVDLQRVEDLLNYPNVASGVDDGASKPVEVVGDISGIESISTDVIWRRTAADSVFGSSLSICDNNLSEMDARRCSTACKEHPPPVLQALETPILRRSISFPAEEPSQSTARCEAPVACATYTVVPESPLTEEVEVDGGAAAVQKSDVVAQVIANIDQPSGSAKSCQNDNLTQKANEASSSKTIVANRMKRKSSRSPFFRKRQTAQEKLVLLNPMQESAIPRHPNPFASNNTFYDELWRDKQEAGFTKWINYILTPPDDINASYSEDRSADAKTSWFQSIQSKDGGDHRAPSRECLSLKIYTAKKRLNALRRQAVKLYQSPEVSQVVQRIEVEISTSRLKIRKDKAINADIGMKELVLKLLLGYNSLWLRIGIETILGEVMILQSNADKPGIIRFINQKFLFDADLARRYAHSSIQQHYREGYDEAYKRMILRRILLLIYLLDYAKRAQLIQHDPCLFNKDALIKSNQMVLIEFSRNFMCGEGDLIKHLRLVGYCVSHEQKPLHEFEFATNNIAVDLRDGLRLTRVLQLLTGDNSLLLRMRVPAYSRLHKIHNLGVVLDTMSRLQHPAEGIVPKDVVDGNRDKTLALLWHIVFHFQLGVILDEKRLEKEILHLRHIYYLRKTLANQPNSARLHADMEDVATLGYGKQQHLLLSWCNAVCALYNMKIWNFTVSFSDGRALCYLVHHYHPNLLPLNDIMTLTTHTYASQADQDNPESSPDESFSGNWAMRFNTAEDASVISTQLLANEQHNFKLAFQKISELGGVPIVARCSDMSNTIPDEKITITQLVYICTRLLGLGTEINAARVIQCAWRKYLAAKQLRIQHEIETRAACKIQALVRSFLQKRRQMQICCAVQVEGQLESDFDADLVETRRKREKSIIKLQAIVRGYIARRRLIHLRNEMVENRNREMLNRKMTWQREAAAVVIQRAWRKRTQMIALKKQLLEKEVQAAIVLQKYWRGHRAKLLLKSLKMKEERDRCTCTVVMQYWLNAILIRRSAAVAIQRFWRRLQAEKMERRVLAEKTAATVIIQRYWRGFKARLVTKELKMKMEMQKLHQMELDQQIPDKKVAAATVIQKHWRGYKSRLITKCLKMQVEYEETRIQAAIEIQKWWKSHRRLVAVDVNNCFEDTIAIEESSFYSCYSRPRRSGLVEFDVSTAEEMIFSPRSSLGTDGTMPPSQFDSFCTCIGELSVLEEETPDIFTDQVDSVIEASIDKTITCDEPSANGSFRSVEVICTMETADAIPTLEENIEPGPLVLPEQDVCPLVLPEQDVGPLVLPEQDDPLVQRDQNLARNAENINPEYGYASTSSSAEENCLNPFEEMVVNLEPQDGEQLMSSDPTVNTFANRLKSSLEFLLRCRNLTTMLEALLHLEISTRNDPSYCKICVSINASNVLITIINRCNRSVPHKDVIQLCVDILYNIAQNENLKGIWETEDLIETLLKLMGIYYNNGPSIFIKCCSILKLFATNANFYMVMRNNSTWMEKLSYLHAMVSNRLKNAERLRMRKSLMNLPILVMDKHYEEFVKPAADIFCLLETFKLEKKN